MSPVRMSTTTENIKKNQAELKNTVTEIKDSEEQISDLEHRVEITQAEQKKEKKSILKNEDSLRPLGQHQT